MKHIALAVTVLCLVFAPLSGALAQETVTIYPRLTHGTVYVNAGTDIVLHAGWAACTRGLIPQYLSAVNIDLGINDDQVFFDGNSPYWTPAIEIPGAPYLAYCLAGDRQSAWGVYWDYPIGALDAGNYVISYRETFTHRVVDGADNDGDGFLDSWKGTFTENTFTIVVVE